MNLKLYNSLSSKKETFKPLSNKKVKTYGCGPTVYNDPHIGNFRTFVFYDLLNRVLKMNGYNTVTAVNITDIDDKIINKANELNIPTEELVKNTEKVYQENLKVLSILQPTFEPKATGDIINAFEFKKDSREPNPSRMLHAYNHSASTLNLLRAFAQGGFASLNQLNKWNLDFANNFESTKKYKDLSQKIEQSIKFMNACGINEQNTRELREGSSAYVAAGSVITKNVKKKSLALTRSLQTEVKNFKRK